MHMRSERARASEQGPHHTPHQYGGLTENTTRVERLEPHLNTNTRIGTPDRSTGDSPDVRRYHLLFCTYQSIHN